MSKFTPPTSGGSYVQQKTGKAKLVEKPTQNAPAAKPAPSENPTKAQEA
ncbi:hypothetical protein [Pseudophaeobacter sp.]